MVGLLKQKCKVATERKPRVTYDIPASLKRIRDYQPEEAKKPESGK